MRIPARGGAAIGTALAVTWLLAGIAAGQNVVVLEQKVLCKQPGRYIGWPSIAQASNGNLVAVFSGDRTAHVSPDGKVQMVRSTDQGRTWGPPVTLFDWPIDDRDSGILRTVNGALLAAWFTGPPYGTSLQGHYVIRSTDNGFTWGEPIRTPVTTPHGPIQLRNGRLLYLGLEPHSSHTIPMDYNGPPAGSPHKVSVAASDDDGLSWQVISHFPVPSDAMMLSYDEPQMVELPGGRLIAMFRDNNSPQQLIQSQSDDGGLTWSPPHRTAIHGYPPQIIRLSNGWLLVSYAKRWDPLGEYGCVSRDEGQTWDVDHEFRLSSAWSGDIGYPASVQVQDGSIWTVYYEAEKPGENPCLMATHWRLGADECTQAEVIAGHPVLGTTAFATASRETLCGQANTQADVWYTYTATCTGTAVVAACGAPPDSVLAAYSGTCDSLAKLSCASACESAACNRPGPCLSFPVSQGETYWLRVAAGLSSGDFALEIACGIPANETCATAIPIHRGTTTGSTLAAAAEADAGCGTSATGPDVWYSYTAPEDGTLRLDTCGSSFDTLVSVYGGCGEEPLACNDDCSEAPCQSSASCLSLPVRKGRTYPIRIAGSHGEKGGFQLNVRDSIVAVHEGAADPTTEGWTLDDFTGLGGAVGPDSDSGGCWRIQGNAGAAQRYLHTLIEADVSDATGWTYTARVKVNAATSVFDASFGVIEHGDWWNLHLVGGATAGSTGVFLIDGSANQSQQLSGIDPRAAWHTYQIVSNPSGGTGTGGVTYYLDGIPIGTRARGQGFQVPGMTRLDFGDIDRGAAASDSQWFLVKFELGQRPVGSQPRLVAQHLRDSDPAGEGWTRDDFTGVGGMTGAGVDSEAHWRIRGNAGGAQRYLFFPDSEAMSHPGGWTYTARVKVNAATEVFDASFGVIEHNDWWSLHLVKGGTPETTGVFLTDGNARPSLRVSSVDPSAAYHTYQIAFRPAAEAGAGGVTFHVDGEAVGTRARGQGYQVPGLIRLDFGDIDRGQAASDSQWSLVRFEAGQPISCHESFADADEDGDVDQDDFGAFQQCLQTGPDLDEACRCFDRDWDGLGDGTISADDYRAFVRCASGPAILSDPRCGK